MKRSMFLLIVVVVIAVCGSTPVLGQETHDGPAGSAPTTECVHYGVGSCTSDCSPRCPEGWESVSCLSPDANNVEPTKGSMCVWRNSIVVGTCCRPSGRPRYFVVKWDQRGLAKFYRSDGNLVVESWIEKTPEGIFAASAAEFPGSEISRADVFFADGYTYAGTVCESGGWPKAYDSCQ